MILYNFTCDLGSYDSVAEGYERAYMEHSEEIFNPKQRREHWLKILLYTLIDLQVERKNISLYHGMVSMANLR